MKKQSFFNSGEKGNVEIIGNSRSAEFAEQTLYAISNKQPDNYNLATIHVEKDNKVRYTPDGNPFYGGSLIKNSKAEAVEKAEADGYVFDEESKLAFINS